MDILFVYAPENPNDQLDTDLIVKVAPKRQGDRIKLMPSTFSNNTIFYVSKDLDLTCTYHVEQFIGALPWILEAFHNSKGGFLKRVDIEKETSGEKEIHDDIVDTLIKENEHMREELRNYERRTKFICNKLKFNECDVCGYPTVYEGECLNCELNDLNG